jgi:hypothetical protein
MPSGVVASCDTLHSLEPLIPSIYSEVPFNIKAVALPLQMPPAEAQQVMTWPVSSSHLLLSYVLVLLVPGPLYGGGRWWGSDQG